MSIYNRDKSREKTDVINIKDINLTIDKKHFKKYGEILGDEVLKILKKFQELKYNDSTKWNDLKIKYKIQNIRKYIKTNKQTQNLNINQQKKHVIGTNEYK